MKINENDWDNFLERHHISKEKWEKTGLSKDLLSAIAVDYEKNTPIFNESAQFLANLLQKCGQAHSVRSRIKNVEHLIAKIIRRRIEGEEKYVKIDPTNYSMIITDLIGIRVLHLFKNEWNEIHDYILKFWTPVEPVKAFIRDGDEGDIVDSYSKSGCEVKIHPAGYRSIHYIISTKPTQKEVISEIQVRTIFEEGWSEIDHTIRYPNHTDNKLTTYFLTIFNRLAGSADEMGTFVKDLAAEIANLQYKQIEATKQNEAHLSNIESLVRELTDEKKQSEGKDTKLSELNDEIKKLRSTYGNAYINLDTFSGINQFPNRAIIQNSLNLADLSIHGSRIHGSTVVNSDQLNFGSARNTVINSFLNHGDLNSMSTVSGTFGNKFSTGEQSTEVTQISNHQNDGSKKKPAQKKTSTKRKSSKKDK